MTTEAEPTFSELGLSPELLQAVQELGYETPSAIQAGAIPPLLAGRDLLGQAQTGTGKTAAFALPLLQRLDLARQDVQAIVLTPTRELAMQVAAAVRGYGKHVGQQGVHVLPIYGGQPIHVQQKALRRTVHVVIGTPGRVMDHLRRGTLDLSGVHFFCLDEADEMLNMGFLEDVEWILDHAPEERQIALFSATLPGPIRRIAERYLKDPADVKIERRTLTVEGVEQHALRVLRHRKAEALERLLALEDHDAVLVFVGTQHGAGELAEHLEGRGFAAECIHGGMNQVQRDSVIRRLRARRIQILVATDVAARGLDVDHIGLVVNYDLPRDPEVYVHRIGRTARAGRTGRAISFWQPREQHQLRSIERFSGQPIEPLRLPGESELIERQREKLVSKIGKIAADQPEDFLAWVRAIVDAEGLDPEEVAAAALRLAWGEKPLAADPSAEETFDPADMVEIVIPVGTMSRVRPGDIVGAIAGETGLPGKVVGRINMRERVCFVEVPAQHAQAILTALDGVRIGGRVVKPRLAHPEGGSAQGGRGPERRPQRGPQRGPHRGPHRGPGRGPDRGSSRGPQRGPNRGPR